MRKLGPALVMALLLVLTGALRCGNRNAPSTTTPISMTKSRSAIKSRPRRSPHLMDELDPTPHAAVTPGRSEPTAPVHHEPTAPIDDRAARAAEAVDGYIVFLDGAEHIRPSCNVWPRQKVQALAYFYERAVLEGYMGRMRFESIEAWAAAFGISKNAPLVIVYDPEHALDPQPCVMQHQGSPVIVYGKTIRVFVRSLAIRMAIHELAHVWDAAHDWELSTAMEAVVQNPDNYPTAKARENTREDFAESVTAYLQAGYAINERWSDDDLRFYRRYGEGFDTIWPMDRYDYVAHLFAGDTVEMLLAQSWELPATFEPGEGIVVPVRGQRFQEW